MPGEIQKSLTEKDILYHVFSKFKSEGKYGDILKSQKSIDTYFSIVKKIESIKKFFEQQINDKKALLINMNQLFLIKKIFFF